MYDSYVKYKDKYTRIFPEIIFKIKYKKISIVTYQNLTDWVYYLSRFQTYVYTSTIY